MVKYMYTIKKDYNKETKVRTLKDTKEVSAKELNELFKLPF